MDNKGMSYIADTTPNDRALSLEDEFLHQSYFGILNSALIISFTSKNGDINYEAKEHFDFRGGYDANIHPGDTAISIAYKRNFNKTVETLLSFGARISGVMLSDAVYFGNIDIVKKYVQQGGDVNYETNLHNYRPDVFQLDTACSIAFRKNHIEIVEYLLHHNAKLPGEMMIELAFQNNIQLIQYGLSTGSDINHQTERNDPTSDVHKGDTMLIVALKRKNKDLIQVLLAHKEINCNIIGSAGKTALHHACLTNDIQLIESLINKGADKTYRANKNIKLAFDLLSASSRPKVEEIYRLQSCWNRRKVFISVLTDNGYLGSNCVKPHTHKLFGNIDILRCIVSYI